jgi:hypothetical protein
MLANQRLAADRVARTAVPTVASARKMHPQSGAADDARAHAATGKASTQMI